MTRGVVVRLLGRLMCAAALLGSGVSLSAQTLRLLVPEYLPYTGTVEGKPGGLGVDMVEGIFKRAGLTMAVQVVPNYARCVSEVRAGGADGFFLGSRNRERDEVAEMTDAVVINHWIWVLPKPFTKRPADADFLKTARVGVMLNTNPHVWLRDRGFNVAGTTTSAASLIAMVDAGRLDAALVPELVFQRAVQGAGKSLDDYAVITHSRQPFGIYIARDFLAKHPGLMERINEAIRKRPGPVPGS